MYFLLIFCHSGVPMFQVQQFFTHVQTCFISTLICIPTSFLLYNVEAHPRYIIINIVNILAYVPKIAMHILIVILIWYGQNHIYLFSSISDIKKLSLIEFFSLRYN